MATVAPSQEGLLDSRSDARQTSSTGERSPERRSIAAVMGLIGAVAALVAARPISDNSLLTHLATGRFILADGVPTENPFLYTGTAFPIPSWWWSVLLATAERVGSATAIRLLTAVVAFAVGAAAVRLAGTARRGGERAVQQSLLSVLIPSGLALFCLFGFLNGRPHLAGFLLLALALVVFNEERSPWWMVVIFAVWANVHGTWLYGVAIIGLLALARLVDDRRWRSTDLWRGVAAVGGVIIGGMFSSPMFELVLLPTRQFGDPIERQALKAYTEWSRVPLDSPMLWTLIALAGIAFVGAVRDRRAATAVVAVVMGLMGWSGGRLMPIAALTLIPFAASALRDVGTIGLPGRTAALRSWVATAVIIVLTVGYVLVTPGYRLERYPTEAVDWLESRDLIATADVRVMSHDYVGNYLEWRYGADANAYVDDRPDAATLVQYARLLRLEDGWADDLRSVDPDVVLWHADKGLSKELAGDDRWIQAEELGEYRIFCRMEIAERCS